MKSFGGGELKLMEKREEMSEGTNGELWNFIKKTKLIFVKGIEEKEIKRNIFPNEISYIK